MDRLNTWVAEERKEIKREPSETEFPKGARRISIRDLYEAKWRRGLFRKRECPGCQPDTQDQDLFSKKRCKGRQQEKWADLTVKISKGYTRKRTITLNVMDFRPTGGLYPYPGSEIELKFFGFNGEVAFPQTIASLASFLLYVIFLCVTREMGDGYLNGLQVW